jgi:hypothetical protein
MGITTEPHLPVLPWVPAHPWMAYVTALLFIVPGLTLLIYKCGQITATLLGIIFAFYAVTLIPFATANPLNISLRTIVFESLAMAGGSFVLAGTVSENRYAGLSGKALDRLGRYLFGVSLVVFGVDHLLMLGGIAELVPFWFPFHLFWAWLTAIGFIAAGVSISSKWKGEMGGTLIGLMFLLWVVVLHGPRTLGLLKAGAGPRSPAEWSSLFIALGMCGASWICVGSLSRYPPRNNS